MIQPLKVKQRQFYLESNYEKPTHNLSILESSARRGNIRDLESYSLEWCSYNKDNYRSLKKFIDIMEECYSNNKSDKVLYILENHVIPKVKDIRSGSRLIHNFLYENDLPTYEPMIECNKIATYDRIIRNQRMFNLDFSEDWEDNVLEICNYVNDTNISINDKFAISLENSLYTYYLNNNIYRGFSYDDIENLVEMYYTISEGKEFNYDKINIIDERYNDEIGVFKGAIVTGILGALYIDNKVPPETIISKIDYKQLKYFEKTYRLTPVDFVDIIDISKALSTAVTNDYGKDNIVETKIVTQKVAGISYKALAYYNNDGIWRISLIYTDKHSNVVLVPIYTPVQYAAPIVVKNGQVRNIQEEVLDAFYEVKKMNKKSKKKKVKSKIDIKKELAKINFKVKDSGAVAKLKTIITKLFKENPQAVVDGLPDIFAVIRTVTVFGSFVLNPYLGVITFITMNTMKLHVNKDQGKEIVKQYDKEIKAYEKKMEKAKSDKKKAEYKKIISKLEDDRSKLDEYYEKYKLTDDDDDWDDDFLDESTEVLLELSFTNKLKLAGQNFKKAMLKMSDAEKKISSQMDHAYDRFTYTIEKNMSNKNREAVIKGSVIPSFSSLIKLALTAGTVSFVSPVLAAITVMGGLAASKRATANERKYILDEIDIQLKVVKKKLDLAESNNDMKAYEQLLRIQRQLESEKHRIIYKKKRPVIATKYN